MTLAITIFSDFACPFSYLAENALRRLDRDAFSISYRATRGADLSATGAESWLALEAAALEEAIVLRPAGAAPATGKAHEAAMFARKAGGEDTFRAALFAAYWGDSADIGRIDVLTGLAASAGLDPEELKIALDIDLYTDAVRADMLLAERLQIRETPVTYFGSGRGAKIVTGGYTSAQLQSLLQGGDFNQAGT